MKSLLLKISFFLLSISFFTESFAQTPTRLVVRAQSKDAKFIGTSMGGAMVTVRDANTGELLASGLTRGSTGNTELIMNLPRERGKSIVTDDASKFETEISISEPTFVTITVTAPAGKKQAAVEAQTQLWMIPGKPIDGEGVIVEIPGMVVDVLSPQTHEVIQLEGARRQLTVRANVVMMCGCPISEGGMWDIRNLEVTAIVTHNSGESKEYPLAFTGKTSTFAQDIILDDAGSYEITVYAYNSETGNTGLDKTFIVVR
ncbi:MAG: hypothetical protein ACLFUB_04720 [Cyclobacteriaceae bacterium]